jgi:intraflagellar transport protein 52
MCIVRGAHAIVHLPKCHYPPSGKGKESLSFSFPYGASLVVQKPAFPILSSGHLAIPLHRPVAALWEGKPAANDVKEGVNGGRPGRICVLGSTHVLHDDWLDKDDNAKV